jgi:transcriptional regulator with PAS, ATPase and Fis domain
MGRFIPYTVRRGEFEFRFDELLHPLNLAALSPTLIESELFGHRRGAFTGALEDRIGWLEACQDRGVIFLDEIGELEGSLQVKLLRVLQEKTFQRIGETKPRLFRGKIIAATNRDLAEEMQAGRFRRDLYYRLCADIIQTPSLAELIGADRDELRGLIAFIAAKLLPSDHPPLAASRINNPPLPIFPDQRTQLVDQTLNEIKLHVGWDYAWPGNFRELEQCTRNVLIRGRYVPLKFHTASPALPDQITNLNLTADELLTAYCQHAYEKLGSYRRAAARLKLDRRTLRARVHGNRKDED